MSAADSLQAKSTVDDQRETIIILDNDPDARNVYLASWGDSDLLQNWLAERGLHAVKDCRNDCIDLALILAAIGGIAGHQDLLFLLTPRNEAAVRRAALSLPHRLLSIPSPTNVTVLRVNGGRIRDGLATDLVPKHP